jgi:hypothetical protein
MELTKEHFDQQISDIRKDMVTKEYLDGRLANFVTKNYLDGRLAGFATKDDLKNFATKEDLKNFATKQDLKSLYIAIKDDLKNYATKEDLTDLHRVITNEISDAIADLAYTINETIAVPLARHIQECERQWAIRR